MFSTINIYFEYLVKELTYFLSTFSFFMLVIFPVLTVYYFFQGDLIESLFSMIIALFFGFFNKNINQGGKEMDDFHNQHTDLIGTIQDLNKNVKDLQDKIFLPKRGIQ